MTVSQLREILASAHPDAKVVTWTGEPNERWEANEAVEQKLVARNDGQGNIFYDKPRGLEEGDILTLMIH